MIEKFCMRNLLIIWKISTEKKFRKSKKNFKKIFTDFFFSFLIFLFKTFSPKVFGFRFFLQQIFFSKYSFNFLYYFALGASGASGGGCRRAKRAARRRPRCRSRRLRQQRVWIKTGFSGSLDPGKNRSRLPFPVFQNSRETPNINFFIFIFLS